MKTVIKLLLVAVVINATWRIGSVYYDHFQFVDSVREVVQFRGFKPEAEIHDRVFELASKYSIPVTDANLTIKSVGPKTFVTGSYVRTLEPFPGFKKPWTFTVDLDVITSLTSK